MSATEYRSMMWADIAERARLLKAWEAANPELAAAWNAAREEDEARRVAKEEAAAQEARRKHVRQTAPKRLIAMGAPSRCVEVWDAGVAATKATRAVERMREEGKTFLLLSGGTGAGKTVAAVSAMAAHLMEDTREDVPTIFVRASECARLGLYDADDKRLTSQMHAAGLLVVDDLGAEFMSEGSVWRTLLDELVDARYGERRATVLTTNLDAAGFKARYGERIADRIRHSGIIEACGDLSLRERGKG